jgi:hypothetical protein
MSCSCDINFQSHATILVRGKWRLYHEAETGSCGEVKKKEKKRKEKKRKKIKDGRSNYDSYHDRIHYVPKLVSPPTLFHYLSSPNAKTHYIATSSCTLTPYPLLLLT